MYFLSQIWRRNAVHYVIDDILLDTTLKLDTFVTVDLFLHLFTVNDITVKPCETWCVRPTQLALSPSMFSLLNICFSSHTWLCICIRARTMQYIYDVYVYDLFINYSGFKLLFILSMKSILANQFTIARKSIYRALWTILGPALQIHPLDSHWAAPVQWCDWLDSYGLCFERLGGKKVEERWWNWNVVFWSVSGGDETCPAREWRLELSKQSISSEEDELRGNSSRDFSDFSGSSILVDELIRLWRHPELMVDPSILGWLIDVRVRWIDLGVCHAWILHGKNGNRSARHGIPMSSASAEIPDS